MNNLLSGLIFLAIACLSACNQKMVAVSNSTLMDRRGELYQSAKPNLIMFKTYIIENTKERKNKKTKITYQRISTCYNK